MAGYDPRAALGLWEVMAAVECVVVHLVLETVQLT